MDKKEVKKLIRETVQQYWDGNNQNLLLEDEISLTEKKKYASRYAQQLILEEDMLSEILLSDFKNEVSELIKNEEWEERNESLPNKFLDSLSKNKRPEFLTPYTVDELRNMDLYLLKGIDAGFAIKDGDDIVAVHNNSNAFGIGEELVKSAIKHGGRRLDHFDGPLSGLYAKLGFKPIGKDKFNVNYAPQTWKYKKIDAFDPNQSVYAKTLNKLIEKVKTEENLPLYYKKVIERYEKGMPDIIYRKLK